MNVPKTNDTEKRVLKVIRNFLKKSDNRLAIEALNVNASIEDDLGVDSIGRAEILHLLEDEFSYVIDDQLLLEAENVDDIVNAVYKAKPVTKSKKSKKPPKFIKLAEPSRAKNLLQVLEYYVEHDDQKVHLFLQENGNEIKITYGQLYQKAKAVAQGLIQRGIIKGDTVGVMLPTCEDFFYAFFGILYAGAVPIPIYPPIRAKEIEQYVKSEARILENAEVRILITFEKGKPLSRIIKSIIPTLKKITTIENLLKAQKKIPHFRIQADDPALIQYTSGSTGNPKGVLLQHKNLLINLRAIGAKVGIKEDDVIVSWLPLYHDMGLIGAWLGSLYYGIPLILHTPLSFLARPERWLWSIHRHKGTISASPNFGYEFCNRKIDNKDIEHLDLSSWRLALNGAEAIYADTIREFIKRFEKYHFKPNAMYPVYGLAESTVALSFPDLDTEVHIEKIDREIFLNDQRAELVEDKDQKFLEFVSCGKPLKDHEIRIVDDKSHELKERQVGQVQFRGPSTMRGYYNNRAAMEAAYHDGWWDTGDMGYVANSEFFPTGRKKDLIIKAGRNFYPEDIEYAVGELSFIRKGSVVVFGVREEGGGTEKIIVVAEVREEKFTKQGKLIQSVRKKVKEAVGIPPDKILLVTPKTIPKTSSGKLRRSATKEAYLKGDLKPIRMPVWVQLTRLFFRGIWQNIKSGARFFLRCLYGVYIGVIFVLILAPTWLSLFIFPQKINSHFVKLASRVVIFFSGCPLKIKGLQNIKRDKQYIFVSNHTSYADTIVLLAILPAGVLLLAKQEVTNVRFLKSFIKRLGHPTTTRGDFRKSEEEIKQVNNVLKQKKSIVIYPEGTFTYSRGIRHFKLGAFIFAVENKLPVCPIALKGIRDILRSGELLPFPRKIEVTIEAPIDPKKEIISASELRDKTKCVIAKNSGEEAL